MLYIKIDKALEGRLPARWDRVQDMHRYLHRMGYNYHLHFETKMFALKEGEQYQCVLIRWENRGDGNKRNVVLETSDPAQMEAVLLMLISEAEIVEKAIKLRSLR